jgi:hypothetical protein
MRWPGRGEWRENGGRTEGEGREGKGREKGGKGGKKGMKKGGRETMEKGGGGEGKQPTHLLPSFHEQMLVCLLPLPWHEQVRQLIQLDKPADAMKLIQVFMTGGAAKKDGFKVPLPPPFLLLLLLLLLLLPL